MDSSFSRADPATDGCELRQEIVYNIIEADPPGSATDRVEEAALSSLTVTRPISPRKIAGKRPYVRAQCVQPPDLRDAFKQLLHSREVDPAQSKSTAWVFRDLHEEAIVAFLDELQSGAKIDILAPVMTREHRSSLKIDASLKAAVSEIASARHLPVGAIYYTAFSRYLQAIASRSPILE